jgi:hypothetical protein
MLPGGAESLPVARTYSSAIYLRFYACALLSSNIALPLALEDFIK